MSEEKALQGESGSRADGMQPRDAPVAQMPLVSIVTVVRNGEKHIERAIQSVLSQTYRNIEYIMVDGGSTDGTLDIIRSYEARIACWSSERDDGIYHAMNKGIRRSTGTIVGIINADDWYEPDAVLLAVQALEESGADYCYGSIYVVDARGARIGISEPLLPAEFDRKIYGEMPFAHPSVFVRRSVYLNDGLFDTAYKLSADHEFLIRIHKRGRRGADLGQVVANFRVGGAGGGIASYRETRDIAIAHGKPRLAAYATYASSLIKLGLVNALPMPLLNLAKRVRGSRHRNLASVEPRQ